MNVKGIRVFVPASQTGLPRNEPMSQLVKTRLFSLRITEVNRARRRVVGSIRAVTDEARKAAAEAQIWDSIEVGKHYTGTVKCHDFLRRYSSTSAAWTAWSISPSCPGAASSIPLRSFLWAIPLMSMSSRLDAEKKKISLGMKDRTENPWETFMSKYEVGDVADVKIVKLMSFGAFAEVVPGVDGLIHISQIADHRVEKPEDELAEGDIVKVKITDINTETQEDLPVPPCSSAGRGRLRGLI